MLPQDWRGLDKGYARDVLKAGWMWQLLSKKYTRQKEQRPACFCWFLRAVSTSLWLEDRMKEGAGLKFDRCSIMCAILSGLFFCRLFKFCILKILAAVCQGLGLRGI